MTGLKPPEGSELGAMMERLRPDLEALFECYGVPPDEAERIVFDYLVILGARRRSIHDPDGWLLDAIRARCELRREEELAAGDLRAEERHKEN